MVTEELLLVLEPVFSSEFSIIATLVDMDDVVAENQTWPLFRQGGHLSVASLRLQRNYSMFISCNHTVKVRAGGVFV